MANGLIYFLVGLEVTFVPIIFFSIYNPIKKKEELLKNSKTRLNKIKVYMIRNLLSDLKPFMLSTFLIMLVSIVLTISAHSPSLYSGSALILFILFIFFVMFSSIFITEYVRSFREKEAIYEAKKVGEIFSVLGIQKKYHKKIENFISSTWKDAEPENWLLSWFLDSLFYPDKRIIKKKK